jgi:hypothetical protein
MPDWQSCCTPSYLPCKTYWNKQYLMDQCLMSATTTIQNQGLGYMLADDNKRAGFRLYSTASLTCCMFCVDSVCYEIMYGTQTRGSGGPLNTQNSIHIAYFDLVPYRCCASATTGGFFANGNPCTVSAPGCSCCLMFVKQDLFHNCCII